MPLGLIGQKVGMTQVFDDKGVLHPVTVINAGPCPVLQIRTQDRDGYDAVQLGFKDKPRKKATRAERGHVASDLESKTRKAKQEAGVAILEKANCEPQRHIREFRLDKASELKVGTVLGVKDVFEQVPRVDVIATSKGRGYQGVMRRHGYSGLRTSHGIKKGSRQRGSIGSHAANRGSGRPKKGIRMAGQFGNAQITTRNLTIVKLDPENNLILVRGAVPGPNGGVVLIRPTNKKK
jgi:large subunit ribosomal protein L3